MEATVKQRKNLVVVLLLLVAHHCLFCKTNRMLEMLVVVVEVVDLPENDMEEVGGGSGWYSFR